MAFDSTPLRVEVVSAEGLIWEGDAVQVIARTTEGDIGILANHEPFMGILVPGAAEVFTTDGRIIALDLTVLEDDLNFFPKYNVSFVVNEDIVDQYPQIADLFAPITEKLTDETLIELNAKIDVEGREPADVAFEWLEKEGFVTPA